MPATPKTAAGPPWRCDLTAGTVTHRDSGLTVSIIAAPPRDLERERLRELSARGDSVRHHFADAAGLACWVTWRTVDADAAITRTAPSKPGGIAQAARDLDRTARDAARAWVYAQGKATADAARASNTGRGAPSNPARHTTVTPYRSPRKAAPP